MIQLLVRVAEALTQLPVVNSSQLQLTRALATMNTSNSAQSCCFQQHTAHPRRGQVEQVAANL